MNYKTLYQNEIQKRLRPIYEPPKLTMEEIQPLPEPVQKYLIYAGAIGKAKIQNVRVVWTGSMKRHVKSGWMVINSQQYNFFDEPARLFYINAKMMGIPFDGLHIYSGTEATMQIKIASLFQVVDARGDKMSHGETVTVFNDMCFLAPSTLVSENIQWETINELTVKAKFTNKHISVSAVLEFNVQGELIDFISNDRYYCEDGKTYLKYPWSTPIKNYKDVNGRKVPSFGEAVWHMPDGDFCYARFDLKEIEYNVT